MKSDRKYWLPPSSMTPLLSAMERSRGRKVLTGRARSLLACRPMSVSLKLARSKAPAWMVVSDVFCRPRTSRSLRKSKSPTARYCSGLLTSERNCSDCTMRAVVGIRVRFSRSRYSKLRQSKMDFDSLFCFLFFYTDSHTPNAVPNGSTRTLFLSFL